MSYVEVESFRKILRKCLKNMKRVLSVINTTFRQLRHRAGHTQAEAARYLCVSERTIRGIEAGKGGKAAKARTELYRLKLDEADRNKEKK